jgi:hypothetical protein
MLIELLMVLCGLLVHFLKDLVRLKAEGAFLTPLQYWRKYPYQTLFCVIGAVVGVVALNEAQQLTPITAFAVGYMSNSVADMIGKRGTVRL